MKHKYKETDLLEEINFATYFQNKYSVNNKMKKKKKKRYKDIYIDLITFFLQKWKNIETTEEHLFENLSYIWNNFLKKT